MIKKYPVEFLKTPAGQLQIVRDFIPESKPEFYGKEDAFRFTIWNLYERVCEGIKSFLLLYDNKRFYEAFIIAGHVLETCAMLSYIKDEKTEEAQRENYNKYVARALVGMLIMDLKITPSLEKDSDWNMYAGWLNLFAYHGRFITKDKKNHAETFEKLKVREGKNSEKIKLLEHNYSKPNIEEYIQTFIQSMDGVDEGRFDNFYLRYCNFKHSNVLDCLEGQIEGFQIDRVVEVLVIIITYLSMSKLEPYQHPEGI